MDRPRRPRCRVLKLSWIWKRCFRRNRPIEKSDYEPKTPEADASVDADTVNDATAFLETFFKLYPTATEKELAYYVFGNVIEPIGRDYLYSELVNPIFTKDGDNVKVKVAQTWFSIVSRAKTTP